MVRFHSAAAALALSAAPAGAIRMYADPTTTTQLPGEDSGAPRSSRCGGFLEVISSICTRRRTAPGEGRQALGVSLTAHPALNVLGASLPGDAEVQQRQAVPDRQVAERGDVTELRAASKEDGVEPTEEQRLAAEVEEAKKQLNIKEGLRKTWESTRASGPVHAENHRISAHASEVSGFVPRVRGHNDAALAIAAARKAVLSGESAASVPAYTGAGGVLGSDAFSMLEKYRPEYAQITPIEGQSDVAFTTMDSAGQRSTMWPSKDDFAKAGGVGEHVDKKWVVEKLRQWYKDAVRVEQTTGAEEPNSAYYLAGQPLFEWNGDKSLQHPENVNNPDQLATVREFEVLWRAFWKTQEAGPVVMSIASDTKDAGANSRLWNLWTAFESASRTKAGFSMNALLWEFVYYPGALQEFLEFFAVLTDVYGQEVADLVIVELTELGLTAPWPKPHVAWNLKGNEIEALFGSPQEAQQPLPDVKAAQGRSGQVLGAQDAKVTILSVIYHLGAAGVKVSLDDIRADKLDFGGKAKENFVFSYEHAARMLAFDQGEFGNKCIVQVKADLMDLLYADNGEHLFQMEHTGCVTDCPWGKPKERLAPRAQAFGLYKAPMQPVNLYLAAEKAKGAEGKRFDDGKFATSAEYRRDVYAGIRGRAMLKRALLLKAVLDIAALAPVPEVPADTTATPAQIQDELQNRKMSFVLEMSLPASWNPARDLRAWADELYSLVPENANADWIKTAAESELKDLASDKNNIDVEDLLQAVSALRQADRDTPGGALEAAVQRMKWRFQGGSVNAFGFYLGVPKADEEGRLAGAWNKLQTERLELLANVEREKVAA